MPIDRSKPVWRRTEPGAPLQPPPPKPKTLLQLVEDEMRPLIESELERLRSDTKLSNAARIAQLTALKMILMSRTSGLQKGLKEYLEAAHHEAGGGTTQEQRLQQAREAAAKAFTEKTG